MGNVKRIPLEEDRRIVEADVIFLFPQELRAYGKQRTQYQLN